MDEQSRYPARDALVTLAVVLPALAGLSMPAADIVLATDAPSMAYIGPGAGLSAIGAFLALVAGLAVAVFGFLWYPIKRVIRFMGGGQSDPEESG